MEKESTCICVCTCDCGLCVCVCTMEFIGQSCRCFCCCIAGLKKTPNNHGLFQMFYFSTHLSDDWRFLQTNVPGPLASLFVSRGTEELYSWTQRQQSERVSYHWCVFVCSIFVIFSYVTEIYIEKKIISLECLFGEQCWLHFLELFVCVCARVLWSSPHH